MKFSRSWALALWALAASEAKAAAATAGSVWAHPLERLNAALNDPVVRVRFEEIGAVPIGLDLDRATTFLADEVVKYRDIVTKAGIARIE